jgi:hypothetical protein
MERREALLSCSLPLFFFSICWRVRSARALRVLVTRAKEMTSSLDAEGSPREGRGKKRRRKRGKGNKQGWLMAPRSFFPLLFLTPSTLVLLEEFLAKTEANEGTIGPNGLSSAHSLAFLCQGKPY